MTNEEAQGLPGHLLTYSSVPAGAPGATDGGEQADFLVDEGAIHSALNTKLTKNSPAAVTVTGVTGQ